MCGIPEKIKFLGAADVAAAGYFILRKTKSELPVSGWSTDCGERGREEKGVRIPALAVQPNSKALCGIPHPEHGVQFCHRSTAESDSGARERTGKATVNAGIRKKVYGLCEEELDSSPSERVWHKVERKREKRKREKRGFTGTQTALRAWILGTLSSQDCGDSVRKFNAHFSCIALR